MLINACRALSGLKPELNWWLSIQLHWLRERDCARGRLLLPVLCPFRCLGQEIIFVIFLNGSTVETGHIAHNRWHCCWTTQGINNRRSSAVLLPEMWQVSSQNARPLLGQVKITLLVVGRLRSTTPWKVRPDTRILMSQIWLLPKTSQHSWNI